MGWVNIEERLPQRGEEVLLYLDGVCILHGYLIRKTKNPDLAEWGIIYPYTEEDEFLNEAVTHWMPLPEEPGL